MNSNLKFNNGKFTIMTLGDLHENLHIDNRDKRKRREDMHNLVKAGILTYKPDLIVILGDTLSAKDESEGFTEYKKALRDILKPVIDSRIPFTYVLGNHEHDQGQEELIVEAYKEIETCIGENDTTCTRGNFNCNLLVKNTAGTEDILNLWLIDSNNLSENQEISMYDWVHEDQLEWYEKTAQKIKDEHNGKTIPAIVFQHNPVYEEYELLREANPLEKLYGAVEGHYKFSDKKYVLKDGVEGYLGEGPCTPCYNGGQFASWKKTGDVIGAFFGHDHLNDFTGYVDGIMLGQNKTSGFCCYTDGCRSLVRIINVYEENPWKIESHVRHFKEFGLKCNCLGPIMGNLHDRDSIALHQLGYIGAGVAGVAGLATIIKKIIKK